MQTTTITKSLAALLLGALALTGAAAAASADSDHGSTDLERVLRWEKVYVP